MLQVRTLSHLSIHSISKTNTGITVFTLFGAAFLQTISLFFFVCLPGPVPTDQISERHHLLLILTVGIGWHELSHITLITLCLRLLLH